MVTLELISYIKGEIGRGINVAAVKSALMSKGWTESDINNALAQNQAATTVIVAQSSQANSGPQPGNTTSDTNNRTLITALALIFVYPAGLALMWFWSRWKIWIKIVLSLPVLGILVLVLLMFVGGGLLFLSDPGKVKITTQSSPAGSTSTIGKAAVGSVCFMGSDCQSDICVTSNVGSVCTEGKAGDPCFMSLDCKSPLKCTSGVCR